MLASLSCTVLLLIGQLQNKLWNLKGSTEVSVKNNVLKRNDMNDIVFFFTLTASCELNVTVGVTSNKKKFLIICPIWWPNVIIRWRLARVRSQKWNRSFLVLPAFSTRVPLTIHTQSGPPLYFMGYIYYKWSEKASYKIEYYHNNCQVHRVPHHL